MELERPDDKLDPDIFEAPQEISEADINKVRFKKGVVVVSPCLTFWLILDPGKGNGGRIFAINHRGLVLLLNPPRIRSGNSDNCITLVFGYMSTYIETDPARGRSFDHVFRGCAWDYVNNSEVWGLIWSCAKLVKFLSKIRGLGAVDFAPENRVGSGRLLGRD